MDLWSIYPRWGCVARWQRQSEQATHEVSFKRKFGWKFILPSDMNFYTAKPHGVTLFELTFNMRSRMGQTKLRDCAISRFVLLLILVFPPSLFKASQQTAAPWVVVGAQCPAAKHRRSSASALLGAVMSVVRRGTSLTCMVQGSFFNGTLFWGDQTWCEILLVILRDLPWRWNSALVFGWCHVMAPVLRVVWDQCLRRFCLVVITTSEEEIQ